MAQTCNSSLFVSQKGTHTQDATAENSGLTEISLDDKPQFLVAFFIQRKRWGYYSITTHTKKPAVTDIKNSYNFMMMLLIKLSPFPVSIHFKYSIEFYILYAMSFQDMVNHSFLRIPFSFNICQLLWDSKVISHCFFYGFQFRVVCLLVSLQPKVRFQSNLIFDPEFKK